MITKNNLLINSNLSTGNINYSLDISSEIANFLDTKKKMIYVIKTLSMLNNNLYILLENSFYVQFSPSGKILAVEKNYQQRWVRTQYLLMILFCILIKKIDWLL